MKPPAAGVDTLRLDLQLCFALYSASRAIVRAYAPLLEPYGLTYPQYIALLALWEHDGISVKQLGERLGLDSATLTPLLKRLEKQGIVERHRDTEDERVVRIHVSAAGRALRQKVRGVPAAIAQVAGFDPRNPRALAKFMKLRQELDELTAQLAGAPPTE